MSRTIWETRLYDLDGNGITANYSGYSDKGTTNQIWHGTDRQINFNLNGIDDASFTLYLDDPMAKKIDPLNTVVKIWRRIETDSGSTIYEDAGSVPTFCGVVAPTTKSGEANTMTVRAFNPMWRLQFRFHILNHYLVINTDTDAEYTQSELMWKLIDLINGAFGVASFTGINKGTFFWFSDPVVAPYFVQKGTNTWNHIFDDLMQRAGSPDIIPVYSHTAADPELMLFDTDEKRGTDRSATVNFKYHTGTSDNLDDLVEEVQINPGEFANYLWEVGQGGPNSGLVALQEDNSGSGYGYNNIGIYMKIIDHSELKRLPPLQKLADADLPQAKIPKFGYTVSISPTATKYYGEVFDYKLGDVIMLNADKGALSVTNLKQRIYQAGLANSDNNVETTTLLVANDFTGKIV